MEQANVEKHSKNNILLGTILGYVNFAISIIAGFFFTPWIIKTISSSNYGLYTLSASLINLFLIDFGLSATTNKYLAKYKAEGNTEKIKDLLGLTYKLYLIIDLVILTGFVIIYFLIDYIYVGLTIDERTLFRGVFAISACFSIVSFPATIFNGVISAYEEFVWAKVIDFVNKTLYVLLTFLSLTLGWGLFGLVFSNVSAGLICILIKYILIRKKIRVKANLKFKPGKSYLKEIITFSLWSAIASISSRLIFNVTPSILGIVSDSTNIAVFGIVSTIEGYVYTFGSIMSGFFLPKISRIQASGGNGQDKIDTLAIKIGKFQAFAVILIVVGFICCGQEFIDIWMDSNQVYEQAYFEIIIIVLYQVVYVPETVYLSEIFTNNKVKQYSFITISKALINLILSFVLSYYYGALGASVAIAISRTLELIALNFLFKKLFHAKMSLFYSKVFAPFLIPSIVSIAIGLTLHYFLVYSSLAKFLIIGFSVVFVFCLLSFFLSFKKSEIKSIFSSWKNENKKS